MAHAHASWTLHGNPVRGIRDASPRAPAPRAASGTDLRTFSQPPGWGLNTARGEVDLREMVYARPESKRSSLSPSAQSSASTTSPSTPNPARLAVRRENPVCARRGAALSGPAFGREGGRLLSPPLHARAPPSPTVFGACDSSDPRGFVHFFLSRPWNTRAGRWSVIGGSSFQEANATRHPGPP